MFKFMVGWLGCGMLGTLSGVAARAVYWHLVGVSVITEQTLMPVGVVIAVGTTLLMAGWMAGRLVRGFEDQIKQLKERLEDHINNEKKK